MGTRRRHHAEPALTDDSELDTIIQDMNVFPLFIIASPQQKTVVVCRTGAPGS